MDQTTISLNLENLNDEERKLLMSLVEKGNKPKSKVWKPGQAAVVYLVDYRGGVVPQIYCADLHQAYNIGNVFPTQEAAEEECKRRKILKRWKDLSIESGEEENAWDREHKHCSVYYSHSRKCVDFGYRLDSKDDSATYFPTADSILNAIKEIGADNVKKYILNIKE